MHRHARRLAIVAVTLLSGCSEGDAQVLSHGDAGAPTTTPRAVAFDDVSTLDLAAGDVTAVSVTVVDQGGTHVPGVPVRFALLGEHGDASLESSTVASDDFGRAATRLHASTGTTTFLVRASVDGAPPVERGVGVSGEGFATLSVTPSYTGKRHVDSWIISATAGASCQSQGVGPLLADGPLVAVGAPEGPIALPGIPVGSRVMVTLRSSHSISGCVDVDGLTGSETRSVPALAVNVPLVITPASLALTLDVTPDPLPWVKLVDSWRARFAAAFLGGASSGSTALLDTMAASLSPAQATLFQSARAAQGWDALTAKSLGAAAGPDVLLAMWLPAAVLQLKASPGGLAGQLTAPVSGPATFAPTHVVGLDAAAGDAPAPKAVTWSGGEDDAVKASGSLVFWPSRVVAVAVGNYALAGGAPSVPSAMGAETSCPSLGSVLAPVGPAFGTCTSACLRDLCKTAFATMWARARHADENAGVSAVLAVTIAGGAIVDGDAHLVSFAGAWAGGVMDGGNDALTATIKGAATGVPASSSSSEVP